MLKMNGLHRGKIEGLFFFIFFFVDSFILDFISSIEFPAMINHHNTFPDETDEEENIREHLRKYSVFEEQ